MSNLLAAKAATQWRAAPLADDAFASFAGLVVIHRRADGEESAPVVRGSWQAAPVSESTIGPAPRGIRTWLRALQLYERTWLFVAALVGCAVDPRPEPVGFACVIRFQCTGSPDILARELFACSLDQHSAEREAQATAIDVAAERCESWDWVRVTCDADPLDCEAR